VLTTHNGNDIKGAPNGDDHDAIFDTRPKWPFWIGTGGRFPSESVAVFIGMRSQPTFYEFSIAQYLLSHVDRPEKMTP